jgi:hypothetical protein
MAVLTFRAEQALLWAMFADPGLAGMLGYLEPGDFAWNEHRMLHEAVTAAILSGASAGERREAAAAAAGPGYLDELRAACPDPLHGPAYGEMVMQASARRTVASVADDLADQAGTLGYDAARLVRAVGAAGHDTDVHARHLARLAAAMRSHGAQFNPGTALAPPAPATAESGQARAEERVLAALIQGNRETGQVISMLPAAAFGGPLRREIFTAIRSLYASARPIDALTVDWEVTRAQASFGGQEAGSAPAASGGESYAERLARTSVGDGPVTRTADFLLTQFSPAASRGRHPAVTRPARILHSVPEPAPQPDPGPHLAQPPSSRPGPEPGRGPRR